MAAQSGRSPPKRERGAGQGAPLEIIGNGSTEEFNKSIRLKQRRQSPRQVRDARFPRTSPRCAMIFASDWRAHERNTHEGFVSLTLPSGLVIHGCSLHVKNRQEWVALRGKAQLDRDGQLRKDPNGKQPVVDIPDRHTRDRFQRAAIAAVHQLISRGDQS